MYLSSPTIFPNLKLKIKECLNSRLVWLTSTIYRLSTKTKNTWMQLVIKSVLIAWTSSSTLFWLNWTFSLMWQLDSTLKARLPNTNRQSKFKQLRQSFSNKLRCWIKILLCFDCRSTSEESSKFLAPIWKPRTECAKPEEAVSYQNRILI